MSSFKVKIVQAKFHKDLESQINEFLSTISYRPEQMIYQDTEQGCSCMIMYMKREQS